MEASTATDRLSGPGRPWSPGAG